jgi:hypothetical protein
VIRIRDDSRWISLLGFPHPDPDELVLLNDRIASDPCAGGDSVLAWHPDAGARRIVDKPVVAALETFGNNRAVRQGEAAVATAIL